jgi:hypothetical protein
MRHHSLLCAAALLAAGCAPSILQPLTVSPTYTVMVDPAEISVVQPCAGISALTVEDGRSETTLGRRSLEQKSQENKEVSFGGDPARWAQTGIEEIFQQAHLGTRQADKPALRIKIEQLLTDEIVYRRAEYDARVVLAAEVLPAGGGPACWSTRADGFAENYGYAGNLTNYQETLNHALDRAVLKLLETELPAKLCAGC